MDTFQLKSIQLRVNSLYNWLDRKTLKVNTKKMTIDDLKKLDSEISDLDDKLRKLHNKFNRAVKVPARDIGFKILGNEAQKGHTVTLDELKYVQGRYNPTQTTSASNLSQNTQPTQPTEPDQNNNSVSFS